MSTNRKLLWAGGGILVLLCLVAISIPNLNRSRMPAYELSLLAKSRTAEMIAPPESRLSLSAQAATPEKKLVRNAELGLLVGDVRAAADQIRRLTESNHGEIDKLEITESSGGFQSATLVVRVPASGLDNALTEFKKVAVRTEREQISTRDVTREFYDNEAHLRNLRAEEQQYLTIMKQAHTVKDTLEVSEKLSDVRDRIERLHAQIQLMTHDIEMSAVTITLMQESDARVFGVRWRPLYNAKIAARELLGGLGDWLNWIVAVVIKLPLFVLWIVTVGGILWIVWKIGRSVWWRVQESKAAKAK